MQIDLTADETARLARLLHLADDIEAHLQRAATAKDPRVCGEARECPGYREMRQTCAEGLTPEQSAVAYRRVKERYELTAAQRAKLDVSPFYSEILVSAHNNLWSKCAVALMRAEIRSW